jgi:hypothetical protein
MRTLFFLALAPILISGCVTLGGDPLLAAMHEPSAPVGCQSLETDGALPESAAVDTGDETLCRAILQTITTARGVRNGALELDRAQAGLGGVQIASGVATAGFAMFGAHPDNVLASTLAGGAALAARSGLRPLERRDVLRGGLRALTCTAERGSVFMGAATRASELRETTAGAAVRALEFRTLLTASNRQAFAAEATGLDEALTRLTAANGAARANIGPMLSAGAQVNDTRRLVERNMERQLSALQPDLAAILEAIGKIAPQPATEGGEPQVGSDMIDELLSTQLTGSTRERLVQAAHIANTLAELLETDAGPGQSEFAAIAECATEL